MAAKFIRGCRNLNYCHPYELRSQKWRGNKYIKLKNILRRTGALFDTECIIDDDCRYSWFTFQFLSKKSKDIYAARIYTANHKLVEDIESSVIYKMTEIERSNGIKYLRPVFEPTETDKFGKPTSYKMVSDPYSDLKLECLGNLTEKDYIDKNVDEQLAVKPAVYEEYELTTGLEYGKCLSIVVDEEIITVDIINKHIQRFWELGEISWKAPEPISEDNLVYARDWCKQRKVSIGVALKWEPEFIKKLGDLI